MNAKVITVKTTDPEKVAELLESQLNGFLSGVPSAKIHSTHVAALDIGGTSQAEMLVVCTVFYTQ